MEIFGIYAQFYGGNVSILFVFILRQGIFTKRNNVIPIQRAGNEPTKGLKCNSGVKQKLWDPDHLSAFPQVFTKWENWLPLTYLQFVCWCLAPKSSGMSATCTPAF